MADDVNEIKAALLPHAERLAGGVFGKPDFRTGDGIRYAAGAVHVSLRGARRGRWHNFKTGEGGDLLDLLRQGLPGASFQAVVEEARKITGGAPIRPTAPPPPDLADDGPTEADNQRAALSLWKASTKSIKGTPAERYLQGRGLSLDPWPEDCRFHPATWCGPLKREAPALVTLWRDVRTNQAVGAHRIFIDGEGRALTNPETGKKLKPSLGPTKGAALKLSPAPSVTLRLAICEGVEDGLALLSMQLGPVWACGDAGHIERLPVLAGVETLEIFADADPVGMKAARICAERWAAAGAETLITTAKLPGAKDAGDVASILKNERPE